MDEQAIQDAYNLFVQQGYGKSIDEFKKLITSNPEALNDSYNLFKSQGYNKSIDDYKGLMGIGITPDLKKKSIRQEDMVSPLPTISSDLPSRNKLTQDNTFIQKPIIMQSQEEVAVQKEANVRFNKLAAENKRKEEEKWREIDRTNWTEEDYFTGTFGDALRWFDNTTTLGIGDFVDDMSRSVASGYRQGRAGVASNTVLLNMANSTDEEIQKFIDTKKNSEALAPSAEMQEYTKRYEESGKNFWGVVNGLRHAGLTVLPEVIYSSMVSMATNTDALKAAAVAVGTGTAYGAGTGAAAAGVGAAPGAVGGFVASIPFAFGAASSIVEMGATFSELLGEELAGKDFTKENVRDILNNPEKAQNIKNKAIARGLVIGVIDTYTGKLASGVGAKILTKSAATSAAGAVTKGAVTKALAAGSGVEVAGGMGGEVLGRVAARQDMDISEVVLEGFSELPGGARSTIQARFSKPSYKVNGQETTADEIDKLTETMTPAQLLSTKFDIKNDYEGKANKIQDKIVTHSIKEEVRQSNPTLNEESLDAITQLEKELQKFEGNKTQSAKDMAATIRQKIKDIQLETSKTEQDAIQKQTTDEGVLGSQQPQVGLQEVGKGDTQPEGVATGTEEVAAKSGTQEITREDDVHKAAKDKGIITDSEDPNVSAAFMKKSKEVADKDNPQGHLDKMSPTQLGEMMEYIKALPTQEVKDKVVGSGVVDVDLKGDKKQDYMYDKDGFAEMKWQRKVDAQEKIKETYSDDKELVDNANEAIQKLNDNKEEIKKELLNDREGYDGFIERILDNGNFQKDIAGGKISAKEAKAIIESAGLKVPKDILEQSLPTQEVASMEKQFGKEFPTTPTADKGVSVTNKSAIDNIKTKTTDKGRIRVIESAQRVLKTLKSVLPNFDIVLHDDDGSFNAAMDGIGATQGTRGNFAINKDGSGRIDINLSRANSRTVAHEVAHAVMAKAFGETPVLFEGFRDKISKVLNESANKKLMDFANNYAGDVTYEEYLAELTAMLSQEETNLSVNTLQKIAAIINEIVSKITNGTFKPFEDIKDTKQVVDFFKSISESIRKGEEIDVSGMGTAKIAKSQSKSQININKNEKQQGTSGPVAGNRLFNKPIKAVSEIADRYYKRVFNSERPRFAGTRRLDEARGKRISDAFVAMKDDSNNPEVKSAYKVLAKETLDQYKEFLDAGYIVEINDNEPYGNSQEMINDLRNNKRIKIFSTEAAFGKNKITKKQIEDNPLLTKTDFKDVNGQPLLVNDVFRAIHDFFGHAELGNSFGAIGEENAWNVHARMFSPLARRAMTTETRGQNSYVNFSGVNEKIEVLREEARKLREQGNEAGAQLVVNKIYEEGFFADQKIGLLPDEFSQFDEQDMGDISMRPEGLQERDQEKPKSKSQVIGANANLTATARVHLVLAKELHSQKVKPIDIRMRTGWEMGKDGKWRYEIMPGKFKDIDLDDLKRRMTGSGTYARIGKLGDIFDSPELYDRYPNAKGITVVFKRMPKDEKGSFNTATNDISINEKLYRDTKSVAELTMLHEIQHYVQKVEAFEQGSNTAMAIVLMRTMKKFSADKVKEVKGLYNKIKKDFPADKKAINGAKELMDFTVKKYEILQSLSIHKDTKDDKKSAATIKKELATAYNLYLRVAGEVEARNIGYRRGLTMEQRRRTLLSETENIDIEDQILFENEGELYKNEVKEMEKEFPISKSQVDATNVINKIIKDARAQGFSEESIRVFLEGKGISAAAVKLAMQTETGAATRIKISEELLEGYTNLMSKIDAFIAKGRSDADVISLLKNSQDYIGATDVQKEILVREVRKKLELKQRSAPLADRLLGAIKNITKITMTEKQALIKQIKDLSRGAKNAKAAWVKVSTQLAKEVKELATTGKVTVRQSASVITRFSKVNMFDEKSVQRFVDYMSKVFEDAEYANKLDIATSLLKTAKKNIATKIGIADGLMLPLNQLFSISPNLIPDSVLDEYLFLVDMFGKKQAVLTLLEKSKVIKATSDILNAIEEEHSLVDELADRFNASENKVFNDGKLDYAATLKLMIKNEDITEDEAELMRKYKSDIVPKEESVKMTAEEIAEEREQLIEALNQTEVETDGLPTRDERNKANELKRLSKTDAVKKLSNNELINLLKVLDNINNNYLPHYAQLMVEKLNDINNAVLLTSSIKRAVSAPLSKLYSRAKSLITNKGAIVEMIRRNPLFNIDQLFGDYKTKDIFNAILKKSAEGEANFNAALKTVQNILEKAEERVARSFGLDANTTLMSKFKMMTYMIQLEHDSNQDSKQVNNAADYLRATIKHIDAGKSQFGERDATMLQKILDEFAPDENIDNKKLYDSFNNAEKSAIKDIRGINESLREKAVHTAAVIRGDRINPLTNYVHLNVLHETQPNDLTVGTSFVTEYNNSMRPSTKAKSLIARTGKVSPLNFDVFTSAQRGAKFVLMDYNLTEPIRTARKTINQTIANLEEEGRIPREKRQIINAINSALEEAIDNLLTNAYVSTSIADDVIDFINRQGYRAVLAGTGRFVSELASNVGFALITDPNAFIAGTKLKSVIMSTDAPLIMENVNSTETNRIFPTDPLSGKFIDTNILQQVGGIKGGKAKNSVANKIQQIWNLTGKKHLNTVELIADTLISTPDKVVMRPMWFGSFANAFKKNSGEDVNFEKIAANDSNYMEKHKDAIQKAKTIADERAVMTGGTNNAFMGILKGTVKPDQSVSVRAFNNFNNFMTRFLIFEYVTARTGVMAAMGNGSLTKKQGAALLAGVATRMVVYSLLTKMLGAGLMGLFFDDDEEEEDEKSFMQKLAQAFASAFTSMIFGRDFGNATKAFINYGIEEVNENYLDFLREGEYDPYKDAIQYKIVPAEKKGKQRDLGDFLLMMGGSFGPSLKSADFIVKKSLEGEKKEADAIDRRSKEIGIRIPLEILGNAGFIPLYKDVRKVVMKDIYKGLEEAERTAGDKKKAKEERLNGYNSETDMKRYNPELWESVFGPDAPEYDKEQAIKNIKKEKDKIKRDMKDEMYDYTPKPKKGGFGSRKGGFGSKKFGQ